MDRRRQKNHFPRLPKFGFAGLLLLVCTAFAHAFTDTFRFRTLDNQTFQSIGEVYAIAQDAQGFMWFGGSSGLARYDGYDVKVYRNDPEDPHSLTSNYVLDLLVDYQGRLWIATSEGFNLYDSPNDRFVRFLHDPDDPGSLGHNVVRKLYQRRDGQIWLTTAGGGLNLLDPELGLFTRFQHDVSDPQSISSNYLTGVYEDASGSIWIGTEGAGLTQFEPDSGAFTHYSHDSNEQNSLSNNHAYKIFEDSQHRLWVGTLGGGLNQLNRKTGQFIRHDLDPQNAKSTRGSDIWDIAEFDDGSLLIATDGGGLVRLNPDSGKVQRYMHQSGDITSLSSNKIRPVYQDRDGHWWFGHFPSGVSRLAMDVAAFSNYRHQPDDTSSLSNSSIVSLEEDEAGNLWVGTEEGLNYLNRGTDTVTRYPHNPGASSGLPAPAVLSLHKKPDDHQLWVGTFGGGLSHLDTSNGKFTGHSHGGIGQPAPIDNRVWSIIPGEDQSLWIGSYGGVTRYDRANNRWLTYKSTLGDPTSLSDNRVYSLYEDSRDRLWVGTFDGLNLMDRKKDTFRRYQHQGDNPNSLSNNYIWSIFQDSQSRLWLGTRGGLNRFDPDTEKFFPYRIEDGLPSDTVTGIQEDDQGYLWLGTEGGLSRFDPQTETFRNFTSAHGLPSNVFNRPAALKTRRGEMVFGSTEGLTIFDPAKLLENTNPPPVVLTDFQLFNKPVEVGAENSPLEEAIHIAEALTLRHDQSVFSLSFAALNFHIPEMNQYAYKLVGFDKDWNEVGTLRSATYTNLDPGSYTFWVKASNNDGVWNEEGASLKIVVLPPWYETYWFRIATALLILLSFYLAHIFRTRQIRQSEQNLSIQVKERTRELEKSKNDLEERNREIEHLANHDTLTGLPSLRLANQRLDLVLSIAKRKDHIAAVLFLDLDGFKTVNDTFGHEAGDYVLTEVSSRLSEVIRESDTACRIGGDEFLLILSEVENIEHIQDVCERILEKVGEPLLFQSNQLNVGVSVGCSYYPKHGDSGESLKKTADELMYEVKKQGKNSYLIA